MFGSELRSHVFEAANNVSKGEYFTALRDLRPLMKREDEVFGPQQSELVDA